MIIILALFIIGASGFIGWQIRNYYSCRNKFFSDQILFCEILLSETNFNKTPLRYIIEKNEKQFHKEFLKTLKNFENSLEKGETYKERTSLLNQSEKGNLDLFLNQLGKTNLDNHNNLVNNYKSIVKAHVDKYADAENKKGSALFKISICIGVMLAILFI